MADRYEINDVFSLVDENTINTILSKMVRGIMNASYSLEALDMNPLDWREKDKAITLYDEVVNTFVIQGAKLGVLIGRPSNLDLQGMMRWCRKFFEELSYSRYSYLLQVV